MFKQIIKITFLFTLLTAPLHSFDWARITKDKALVLERPHIMDTASPEFLEAPFAVIKAEVSSPISSNMIEIDLGGNDPAQYSEKIRKMTLIGERGWMPLKLNRIEKRTEAICSDQGNLQSFYVGIYQPILNKTIGQARVALAGTPTISEFSKPVFKMDPNEACRVGHYRSFTTVECIPTAELYYGNDLVISATPDFNNPKIEMLNEFTVGNKRIYLIKVGVTLEDTVGLLFKSDKTWKFLYRTTDPPLRKKICL